MPHRKTSGSAPRGLRFTNDRQPGYARQRRGSGFIYLHPSSKRRLRSKADHKRIASLAIPPAWQKVWICRLPNGHLQATGIDARGRKQYIYHPDWSHTRNVRKFDRMLAFGRSLPDIRRSVDRDLRLPGLPRDKVIACVVRLVDRTLIRIGNDEYAKDNKSYGLTTMRNGHVTVTGSEMKFQFAGKSGQRVQQTIGDAKAARIVRRCQDLPGQELFEYMDADGERHDLGSADINEYLSRITNEPFTAKDFRTWGGTVVAADTLRASQPVPKRLPDRARETKRLEVLAVTCAADALGNTVATCRKFYVHPKLIEVYGNGDLHRAFKAARRRQAPPRMTLAERAVLRLLKSL